MARPKAAEAKSPEPVEEITSTDLPVYDERGNVRPHGTPGAVPMTYAERVEIAKRLADEESA